MAVQRININQPHWYFENLRYEQIFQVLTFQKELNEFFTTQEFDFVA